ncbi:MAG TPA: hypothetical protein VF748_14960 [Candidatus Acidoferrum sp.]
MPDFEITLPNGTKIGGSAPEGTTQEQIIAEYEKQYSKQNQSFLKIFGGGLVKGMVGAGAASEPQMPYESEEQLRARGQTPQVLEENFPTPERMSGRVVQGIGEGLGNPMAFVGGPGKAALAGRVGASVASGVGSELAGMVSGDNPVARIIGGVAGGTVPRLAVRAGGRVAGAISPRADALPPSVAPERSTAVGALRRFGVEPSAGDALGSQFVRSIERNADRVFGKGYHRLKTRVLETFTQAAARSIGEDAKRLTPEIFQRVENRGDVLFQRAATSLPFPQGFGRQGPNYQSLGDVLQKIQQNVNRYQTVDVQARITPLIQDVQEAFFTGDKEGTIDGRTYQALTTYGSMLGKATRDTNGNVADYARQIKSALNNHLMNYVAYRVREAQSRGRAGGPARAEAIGLAETYEGLQRARREYRNMLILQKAMTGPGEEPAQGLVFPDRLRAALLAGTGQAGRASYATGQGQLAQLANAGTAVIEPYRAPGWERWATGHAVGVGLALLSGGPVSKLAASSIIAPELVGKAVNRPLLQNMLKNQRATSLLNQLEGARDIAARSAAQSAATLPAVSQQRLAQPSELIGKRAKDYAGAFSRRGLLGVAEEAGLQVPAETGVERFLKRDDVNTALGTMTPMAGEAKFIEGIRKLASSGKSMAEIGKLLSLTRNQVAGIMYRNGIKGGGRRISTKPIPDDLVETPLGPRRLSAGLRGGNQRD